MKIRQLFQNRRTHLGAVLTTAVAFLLLGSINPAFAKKGGNGGGPGGGGEDPPTDPDPVEVPFHYQITWHEPTFADETLDLRDVAPDGTVVGAFKPGGVFGSQIAIIRFPDGSEVNLEDLLIDAGEVPPDWRVTFADRICDDLLVGVDIYDPNGRLYCGAIKFDADQTLDWFALFGDPDGEDAFLQDATETGDFLIATGDITDGIGSTYFGGSVRLSVWNPSADATLILPGPVEGGFGGWFFSSISDYLGGSALVVDSRNDYFTPEITLLPGAATAVSTVDIGADGTVIATIEGRAGTHHKRDPGEPTMLARWTPETNSWETIVPCPPNSISYHPFVNGSGEIAGSSGGELFVFHDDYGLQSVNNMIHPSQASQWDSGASYRLYGFSDPIQDAPYSGVILGRESGGSYFTLTPVVE